MFVFVGDDGSDLELSDPGSVSSVSDSDTDDFDHHPYSHSRSSSFSSHSVSSATASRASMSTAPSRTSSKSRRSNRSASGMPIAPTTPDAEFRTEVQASLARAFAENHSVDNAAVELKTLRMASNVPLRMVREAVIGAVVDRIGILDSPAAQRAEISKVVERWGPLIVKIGGSEGVETVELLQVSSTCSVCALGPQLISAARITVPIRRRE